MDKFQLDISSLYASGKSMTEIAQIMGCSVHKIAYWMSKMHIKRRSHSEATYVKENPLGDPFKIKVSLSPAEHELYGLGLGIYWGEGEKVSKGHVRVANSDPALILKFREFLGGICQVNLQRVHYSIVCFNDSNPEEVSSYWSKILKISPKEFGKIVQIPTQGKGTYKKKSRFGVCTLIVNNTKLKSWILFELEKLKN